MSSRTLELTAAWILKTGLAAVFLWAAWPKLLDPATFSQEVSNYQLLPELAPYIAATLPGVELILAVALLLFTPGSAWLQASAALSALLMAAFTVAVTQVLVRGIDIECGCFGAGSDPVSLRIVLRDVVLLAACVVLAALPWRAERATGSA